MASNCTWQPWTALDILLEFHDGGITMIATNISQVFTTKLDKRFVQLEATPKQDAEKFRKRG